MRAIIITMLLLTCSFSASAKDINLGEIKVPEEMKNCKLDTDCVLQETSCSQCCSQDAINKGFREEYAELKAKQCGDWRWGVCDCDMPGMPKVICKHSVCIVRYMEKDK